MEVPFPPGSILPGLPAERGRIIQKGDESIHSHKGCLESTYLIYPVGMGSGKINERVVWEEIYMWLT
jgi:hypothetical protein